MPIVRDREDDRSTRFWTWLFLGVIGVIPLLAVFALYMAFDPNDYKSEIVEQVRKATGRELTLGGPIRLKLALRPTVDVSDVSFANMDGGSAPRMLQVARVEATLGLFALLQKRVEIDRLTLEQPEILLESDAQGRANWKFAPQAPPGTAGTPPPAPRPPGGFAVEIREVRIAAGKLTWRAPGAAPVVLPLTKLDLDAEQPTAPMSIQFHTAWNGVDVGVNGQVGSFAGLQGASQAPWPFRLVVTAAGAKLNLTGALAHPTQHKGYHVKLEGAAPELAALRKLGGGTVALPALRDVSFSAEVVDRASGAPEISDVSLRAGGGDLDALVPGLRLGKAELVAPNLAEGLKLDAQGTMGALPVVLGASVGTPLALLGPPFAVAGKPLPLPVDVNLTAGGAAFSARGNIADPAKQAGMDLAIVANVPDLRALAPGLGPDIVPALRDVKFQARLQTGPQGPVGGISLREMALAHKDIDVSGEVAFRPGPRPGVQANLAARRINVDALRSLAGTQPAAPRPRTPEQRGERRVIPDTQLPFAAINLANVDVQLRAEEMILDGAATRNLALRLVTQNGQLKLDPFSAELPAGRVTASLSVDNSRAPPPVALVLRSPGLSLKRVYNEIGREGDASGAVEVDLDIRGTGATPRAIAAGATGYLGLAVVGGTVDNRILNLGLFGDLVRGANLGDLLGRGGTSNLRCFAARLEAQGGNAEVKTLLLDSSTMLVEGSGRMNLADESLALRMRVQARLQGLGVVLPVRVGGTLGSPRVFPDPAGLLGAAGQTAGGTAGTAADIVGGGANAVTGALGLGNAVPALPDNCAAQLAIARGGRQGAVPAVVQGQGGRPAGRGGRSNSVPGNPLQRLLQ